MLSSQILSDFTFFKLCKFKNMHFHRVWSLFYGLQGNSSWHSYCSVFMYFSISLLFFIRWVYLSELDILLFLLEKNPLATFSYFFKLLANDGPGFMYVSVK